MARRPTGPRVPTPVESITHDEKRTNLPTADAHEFVSPQVEAVRQVAYARDASLDPQLIWRGKYPDGDPALAGDLVADAPPIYIQEKVDPRVLVENLRQTARAGEVEPELTLFDTFDGLDELDAVEFYRHEANWSNRMILGDSLQVMASMAERENLRGRVQMIYIDPPYGIKFGSNWQVSARKRDVKDGKLEDAAREAEQIKAFRDTWELGIHSYLSYLRDRLLVARELLTESGSCFVQIGDENVHLVRSLMDEVFGRDNFVSLISFDKTSSSSMEYMDGVSDYLLWFAKDFDLLKYRALFTLKSERTMRFLELADGTRRPASRAERQGLESSPAGARWYEVGDLTSQTDSSRARYEVEFRGLRFPAGKRNWATPLTGMKRAIAAGRVERRASSIGFVRFADDFPAVPLKNNWGDTGTGSFTEDKIYVVQSGTKVVQRCMLMCTDPGDLVLDPTCGSGTTAYVAEQWGRRWITVDTSRVALALARQRLMGAKYPYYLLADSEKGRHKEQEVTGIPLPPTPTKGDVRRGFVYERVQHITLKSIANNPDIWEGMTRQEIDEAIKRHVDFEMLYDRPYEDRSRVRVCGPFTVESLSPHRSLAFAETPEAAGRESISQRAGAQDGEGPTFEQTILDNLRKAGVQNGRTRERITFATLDTHAGLHVQAVGERLGGPSGDAAGRATRIGVAIGPQYGTVSPQFIKAAAKEAIKDGEIDLLCVLGFAFDPQATGVTAEDGVTVEVGDAGFASVAGERQLGRIKVLLVRMNADLLMGEDLKKTGAGNLFTVFGEPDIQISHPDADSVVVTLKGVDVYDPTTGEIRTNDTGQIALWMIDTAYNEESFFVRHCYFTGGNDPYRRLKTSLKAEIDEDAWASLYSTVSRPFPRPESGKIAVKVINDYGDEVMKVFEV
ncbi:MAG: site-specific DNA-methyltransferase [Actinomycetales bacterium]|uniref:Site-specific DNA-methyltransferase n=1 Tax=Candidatus Phosphoribacter hodrii TaxID=2953743 RepID=A0A9D7T7S1_9MICO|nr:site-specific DNA-methyltransferase [Candidatus Phosphoribacter hodrii]